MGRKKSHAHRAVGDEEVFLEGFIAASAALHEGFHLVRQHIAHTDGIHEDEFGKSLAQFSRQLLAVLRHLRLHLFERQQRVNARIDRRRDVGRQMLPKIVDAQWQQVFGDIIENVANALV